MLKLPNVVVHLVKVNVAFRLLVENCEVAMIVTHLKKSWAKYNTCIIANHDLDHKQQK